MGRPRSKFAGLDPRRTTTLQRSTSGEAAGQPGQLPDGLGLCVSKDWDESRGVWKDRPRHDDASHGADAFLTFACTGYTPPSTLPTRKRSFGWVV